ncbi:MAG: hypothetical protein ACJ0DH_00775 [bacterium]
MKFLTTFKISKGFDRWLQLIDDLQPYMDKYGYKMLFASTNDDETVVYDLGEANDSDMAMKMLVNQTSSIREKKPEWILRVKKFYRQ